jgi:predicted PurR-regulated permease PerM
MSLQKLSQISTIFIGLILFFVILHQFQSFLRPLVIAIILTFLFVPVTRLNKEKKRTIWITSTATIITLFLVITIFSALFADSTQEQVPTIKNSFSFIPQETIQIGTYTLNLKEVFDLKEFSKTIGTFLSSLLKSLGSFFSEALLTLLFLFFLLPNHDRTVEKIAKQLDRSQQKRFLTALKKIEQNIRDYLFVKFFVSLGTALTTALVLYLFDSSYVLLFTLLVFILNFIPSIGSIVAVGLIIIFTILTQPISGMIILFSILLILIQMIFGNIIEPTFAGEKLELSPIIILLSLFFWGAVWGIGGMFFAVPLTSIIKIILQHNPSTKNIVKYLN